MLLRRRTDPDGPPGDRHRVLAATDDEAFSSLRRRATPRAARYELGRLLRQQVPRSALARWEPHPGRPDPADIIAEANAGRLDRLVPVRVGRMAASPYAFLRGAAAVMAEDFAHLPATGITP